MHRPGDRREPKQCQRTICSAAARAGPRRTLAARRAGLGWDPGAASWEAERRDSDPSGRLSVWEATGTTGPSGTRSSRGGQGPPGPPAEEFIIHWRGARGFPAGSLASGPLLPAFSALGEGPQGFYTPRCIVIRSLSK